MKCKNLIQLACIVALYVFPSQSWILILAHSYELPLIFFPLFQFFAFFLFIISLFSPWLKPWKLTMSLVCIFCRLCNSFVSILNTRYDSIELTSFFVQEQTQWILRSFTFLRMSCAVVDFFCLLISLCCKYKLFVCFLVVVIKNSPEMNGENWYLQEIRHENELPRYKIKKMNKSHWNILAIYTLSIGNVMNTVFIRHTIRENNCDAFRQSRVCPHCRPLKSYRLTTNILFHLLRRLFGRRHFLSFICFIDIDYDTQRFCAFVNIYTYFVWITSPKWSFFLVIALLEENSRFCAVFGIWNILFMRTKWLERSIFG